MYDSKYYLNNLNEGTELDFVSSPLKAVLFFASSSVISWDIFRFDPGGDDDKSSKCQLGRA